MQNIIDFFLQKEKHTKEYESIIKHIIHSCLNNSRFVILIIEVFEFLFFLVTIIKPDFFGKELAGYQASYMTLFIFCIIAGVLLMYIQRNFEKRYVWVKVLHPMLAGFLIIWALAVTYIDGIHYPMVNPALFMTMMLCIPAVVYITPIAFLTLDITGIVCMVAIIHSSAGRDIGYMETTAHFLAFAVIETFTGVSYLYIRFKYFSNTRKQIRIQQEQDQIQETLNQATKSLALAIDAKDPYTQGHSSRVAEYSRALAKRMGLSRREQDSIYFMGLMHDVGKIGIPDDIINKKEKLTDDEYNKIKQHPIMGYEILKNITSMPDLASGARWHHERFNGTGYPDGLKGEQIPLVARIIAVADAYDTMSSKRSYRDILPQKVIRSEIKANRGTQFDPQVADCMLQMIDEDFAYKMHE